ncbi:MAG: alpha/beta fold hydrolase [Planctomycetaceae bacterium]
MDSGEITTVESRSFAASDGYDFHYRHWKPVADTPIGYVVALHGIQSHSGWYAYSSRRLCAAGYDVRFLDRRGSGRNSVGRGHAPHAERLINDVLQFLSAVRFERDSAVPESPVILLGVSWGGKLAVTSAARRPELLDGLALLYPGLMAGIRPKWHQRLLLRLAVRSGKQFRSVPIPLSDPALFTDDVDSRRFIREDRLALHATTVGLLNASVALDDDLRTATSNVRCPTLMMLAGRDRIIDNAATKRMFDGFSCSERTLLEYPNAAHTLEFEPNRGEIVDDLLNWLGRLSARRPAERIVIRP